MKKYFGIFAVLAFMSFSLFSCVPSGSNSNGQIVVEEAQSNIGDNLNLQAVGEVVKSSSNPQEIEQKLNADDGINNLDLDGDGKRDYLKVTEYGSGSNHGYSICAVLPDGEPEVANVEINTELKQVVLNGNSEYYGDNNTYHSNFDATDFLLMAYLMQPSRSYYHSPYYYGHYGYGYGYRPVVSRSAYYSRPYVRTSTTRTVYKSVPRTSYKSKISSPNTHNKSSVASKRTSTFSKPTTSQKAFKVNNTGSGSTHKTSSGFGSSSKPSTSKSSSGFGSSSKSSSSKPSSSSRSSYGSSKSSSSKSSSSSSRSSRR